MKAIGPGSLTGCGTQHPGDAVGYPFSVVQTGLSGSSWLKGLIDKRARGDMPIAQFDGPDGIPVRVFRAGADEKYGTHSVYLAFGQNRPLVNVTKEYLDGAAETQRHYSPPPSSSLPERQSSRSGRLSISSLRTDEFVVIPDAMNDDDAGELLDKVARDEKPATRSAAPKKPQQPQHRLNGKFAVYQ